ncbi:hypothetical protein GS891_10640 [Rhodococcus hoagii]|nr:hypothetical protein [Prescottella equi]
MPISTYLDDQQGTTQAEHAVVVDRLLLELADHSATNTPARTNMFGTDMFATKCSCNVSVWRRQFRSAAPTRTDPPSRRIREGIIGATIEIMRAEAASRRHSASRGKALDTGASRVV